jgi:hypothetical protein
MGSEGMQVDVAQQEYYGTKITFINLLSAESSSLDDSKN